MSGLMTDMRWLSVAFILLDNGFYTTSSQAVSDNSLASESVSVLTNKLHPDNEKTSDAVLTGNQYVGVITENTIFPRLKEKFVSLFDEVVGKIKRKSAKDLSKQEEKRYHQILLVVSSLCSSGVRLSSPM